jgi:Sap, sulfolipid-1-addressing protein
MLREAIHLIPYALVAALSPTALAATLAVIASGRLKALAFATGLVAGQLLALGVLVAVGTATIPDPNSKHQTLEGLLELALGVVLLGYAQDLRRRPAATHPGDSPRTRDALARLGRLHAFTAFVAGLVLGIGVKRLVLSAFASASITGAGVQTGQQAALIVWYSAIATVLVWGPVLVFELFGKRAVDWLEIAQHWLDEHRRDATIYVVAILGLVLVVGGILDLV